MKKFVSAAAAFAIAAAAFPAALASGVTDWQTEGDVRIDGGTITLTGASSAYRKLSGAGTGVNKLTAKVTNSDISDGAYLYAKTGHGAAATVAIPQYAAPESITLPDIIIDGESGDTIEWGVRVNGEGTVTVSELQLESCETAGEPFLKGGEISKLTYIEDNGGRFRRADGTEGDALQVMAENGFNLARIRVLCNPGKGRGNGWGYLPEGYMTEDDCLRLARRAVSKGMKIEWTFAYSDWWVDGNEQYPPNEWLAGAEGKSGAALADYYAERIYEYTKRVLRDLKEQDTVPELISIGNEIQCGICFGAWQNNNGLYYDYDTFVKLTNAGARAVREECPTSKIVLHSDAGGEVLWKRDDDGKILWENHPLFTRNIPKIDFDVIGVSYYPYYNAKISIDDLVSEFNEMIETYDKDVIVMESGYNWSELRGDKYEGQLQDSGFYQDIYGESRNGQRAFLTELYSKLRASCGGRCLGSLYWDPIMIYDGGRYAIGWAIRESDDQTEGNVVSNSTIFDFDGKAVEGQQAMRLNTNASDRLLVTGKTAEPNEEITLIINGRKYKTVSDRFCDYIAAIEPEDIVLSYGRLPVIASGHTESYMAELPEDGVVISGIDFVSSPPRLTAELDENGLCVVGGIPADAETVFLAAYNADGILVEVKRYTDGGVRFEAEGIHKIKAYAWREMEPRAFAAEIALN